VKFKIRMGVPEMRDRWNNLKIKHDSGTINSVESSLYKKLGKTLVLIASDPKYPGLNTHEIPQLTSRYGKRVWQSYLENKKSKPMRIYWVYGPGREDITIIGLEPHPEDGKKNGYNNVVLSDVEDS